MLAGENITLLAPMILSMTLSETLDDGRAEDDVGVGVEQLVDLLAADVGRQVAGVALGLLDGLAEDATGVVDVLDSQVDARELRRAEVGEVAGLRAGSYRSSACRRRWAPRTSPRWAKCWSSPALLSSLLSSLPPQERGRVPPLLTLQASRAVR